MNNKLQDELEKQKQGAEPYVSPIPGILGIPMNGQKRVEVLGRNSYVYVRLRSNQSEVIQAYNNQVATAYNLPVLVKRQGNKYVVIGVDSEKYENNWSSQAAFIPRHGNSHSFDIESGGGGDVVWVYPRQFTPTLVMPSGSSGAGNVIVNPYILKNDNGTWKYVGGTGTPNITQYNPSSPTGAVMALVYLDSNTGNPQIIVNSGTVFSNSITGSSQIVQYIPTITILNSQIPLAAIRLITGTSKISWDNIYDVRQFIHELNPPGSSENIFFFTSGSSGISSYDLMTESRPLGNYNYYSASVGATGTLLADWITEPSFSADFIGDGIYHVHIHAQKTAGTKDARIRYLLAKRSSGGIETPIHTSDISNIIPTSESEIDIESFHSEIPLDSGDGLVVRIYGIQEGLGTTPTIQIKIEGDTLSRFETPPITSQSSISSVAIQDEGIPKGNVTTFNFVGSGVQATVSGSVANIDVSGGGSINTGTLDARYLKLDTSNDPLIGDLLTSGTHSVSSRTFAHDIKIYAPSGTHNQDTIRIERSDVDGSPTSFPTYNKYAISIYDTSNYGVYKGGILYHATKNGTETFIDPYAPSGTVCKINSDQVWGSSGTLLTLESHDVQKFKVDGLGNTNIPTGSTYNIGGAPHTHAGGASGLPAGYLYGCKLSNNASDATNDIDIAVGKCRDATDTVDIILASALTKRLDASWAVGTNQGGLDTGSIGNNWYHMWVIKRSDTGVVDVLFSLSATSPTMPANYDYKRRIGSIYRVSNAIKAFIQDGDQFVWTAPVSDVNVLNPGTSAVTRTLTVPTGIRVKTILGIRGAGVNPSDLPGGIYISDLSQTDAAPDGTNFSFVVYVGAGTFNQLGGMVTTVFTNTSAQVRSRVEVSTANTRLVVTTHGWMDNRGRDE